MMSAVSPADGILGIRYRFRKQDTAPLSLYPRQSFSSAARFQTLNSRSTLPGYRKSRAKPFRAIRETLPCRPSPTWIRIGMAIPHTVSGGDRHCSRTRRGPSWKLMISVLEGSEWEISWVVVFRSQRHEGMPSRIRRQFVPRMRSGYSGRLPFDGRNGSQVATWCPDPPIVRAAAGQGHAGFRTEPLDELRRGSLPGYKLPRRSICSVFRKARDARQFSAERAVASRSSSVPGECGCRA